MKDHACPVRRIPGSSIPGPGMSRGVLGTVSELEDALDASNFHSKSGPNSGSARAARSTGDDMRLATAMEVALQAVCLCWSTVGCKANSIHVREQKLDGNGNGWKFIDCYWHLLNKPMISKCLDMIWEIAGSPFHVISCLDTLYCAETMRIRNSSTEPIVPIPRPPDLAESLCHWNDMVGIPNLTISQNQDATMKTILQLPGQDVLQWSSQLLRKRWIKPNLPFLSMTWLKCWRDRRNLPVGRVQTNFCTMSCRPILSR